MCSLTCISLLHPQSKIQDSQLYSGSFTPFERSQQFHVFFVLVTGFQNKQHCLRRNNNLDNLYLPLPIFARLVESSCSLVKSLGNGCALVFCSRGSECSVSRKENRMIRVLQLIWESPRFVLINAHHTNFSTILALYSRKESERTHTRMQREQYTKRQLRKTLSLKNTTRFIAACGIVSHCCYICWPWCIQEQKIVTDGEWDQFMETLKQSLPATFRITGTTNKYVHVQCRCFIWISSTVMLIV